MAEKLVVQDKEMLREIIAQTRLCKNFDLNHLDVRLVKDMSCMFASFESAGDLSKWAISQWDTSQVERMEHMFDRCSFQFDISDWDVSNVESMRGMFKNGAFNGNLSRWNTMNLREAQGMFAGSAFRGDISNWNTSKLERCEYMFNRLPWFPNISEWVLPNVLSLHYMIDGDAAACMNEPTVFHWYEALENEACLPGNATAMAAWMGQQRVIVETLYSTREQQANALHTLWLKEYGLAPRGVTRKAESFAFDFEAS